MVRSIIQVNDFAALRHDCRQMGHRRSLARAVAADNLHDRFRPPHGIEKDVFQRDRVASLGRNHTWLDRCSIGLDHGIVTAC